MGRAERNRQELGGMGGELVGKEEVERTLVGQRETERDTESTVFCISINYTSQLEPLILC